MSLTVSQQTPAPQTVKISYAKSIVAIVAANSLWGLSFISLKVTVAVIPPMTLALFRFLIALVILVPLLRKTEPGVKLRRSDIPVMVITGLLGVTLYYYFQNNGVKMTTASAASMIIAAIPVLTIIGESVVFKTKLSLVKTAGVTLSVLGVYFIVSSSQQSSPDTFLGNLFMIGASVSWVAYTLITRPLSARYSLLSIVTFQTLFGVVALVPFSLTESWDWEQVNISIVLHLVYLGAFCSALSNYLYVYAMEVLGAGGVSLFLNLIPVVTVIAGSVLLHEYISGLQLLGGAIILLSVYLVNRTLK